MVEFLPKFNQFKSTELVSKLYLNLRLSSKRIFTNAIRKL